MRRNKAYYRWHKRRIIKKKIDFLRHYGGAESIYAWTRDKPGKLAKGKIHCSCWMCRTKSYDHISHSDAKHIESITQKFKEFYQIYNEDNDF